MFGKGVGTTEFEGDSEFEKSATSSRYRVENAFTERFYGGPSP